MSTLQEIKTAIAHLDPHQKAFTALAHAQILLTLDRADFRDLLGGSFYGLSILLPSDFLEHERSAGRLK